MYRYEDLKPTLFTEEGLVLYVAIRDHSRKILEEAGAFMLGNAMTKGHGDTWLKLACFDRMVEVGELRELTGPNVAGHRVFVRGGNCS